ncbi:hypothetical protein KJ865_04840, partial [Myxococcota bacterium]|nr:hypothetical protein [Myxococcota bacterium]
MKVQPVSNAPERKYPFADQTTWGMRNLLIGASIAVSSLVLACATSGDSEETTPSLPGQKSVTTNISPKPPIPGEETQVASAKSPTQSLFSSAAGDREKDSDN